MSAIGAMRHRLALEAPDGTADGGGGTTVGFATVDTVWAAIAPARPEETTVAGRLDGVVTHRVTLRFRDDVAGGWQLAVGARHFRVLAAYDPDERRRRLVCLCEEEGR